MLEKWDFDDDAANATRANRQKSATRLIVLSLDRVACCATFFDAKREETHTATLQACSCHDFSFAGRSPRKTFGPCMHIYRLATELGMYTNKYDDPAECITPSQAAEIMRRHELAALKQAEDDRLRALPSVSDAWGAWSHEVHLSGVQRNRQLRAYFILDDEPAALEVREGSVTIHGYGVSPQRCGCPDFNARQLPCKHIYVLALSDGVDLSVTASEYEQARCSGRSLLFRYEDA